MTDDPQGRPFREMVWLLREYEGWRCLWRVSAAAATFAAPGLLALGGAVAAIYVGSDLKFYRVVLGAIVSLGGTAAAGLIARRKPWRVIFARRLWTYEAPSPRTRLEVLVRDADAARAWHVLRRNRFVPLYAALLVVPPPDALDLNNRIGVQEPDAWMRSTSDEDRIRRIAAIFQAASLRARVSGRDVFPGARVEPRRADDGRTLAPSAEQTWGRPHIAGLPIRDRCVYRRPQPSHKPTPAHASGSRDYFFRGERRRGSRAALRRSFTSRLRPAIMPATAAVSMCPAGPETQIMWC